MEKFKPYLVAIFAAFIYALGHPNIINILIPIAPIIGTTILFYLFFKSSNLKQNIFSLILFNLFITLFSFHWIANTLVEFGQIPFVLAILANAFYLFLFNPYNWFILGFIYFFKKQKVALNSLHSLSLATLSSLVEYFFPQQFPVLLGQPWIVLSEYLGLASLFGLFAFSFTSYLIVFEVIRFKITKQFCRINISFIILFIALNPVFSSITKTDSIKEKKDFNIRIVQANISNYLKLASEAGEENSVESVLKKYQNLSNQPAPRPIDLIIWPETAYPYPIYRDKDNIDKTVLPDLFIDIIAKQKADLAIGSYDNHKEHTESTYQTDSNAAFFITAQGKLSDVYQKHILIPFGETLPFGPLNELLAPYVQEMAFFKEGETFPVFQSTTKKGIGFISTICYELLKPEYIREYLNNTKSRPDFLINMTNDSWYGDTVEPEQHLFLTKWRAIEFKLPIVRSTNTGISVVIDENGKELQRLNIYEAANLDINLKLSNEKENFQLWYKKFGIWAFIPFILLLFLFHLILLKLKNEKNY